jgi:hypothetical protein
MAETIATLIGRTRRHLMAMHRPEFNQVGSAIAAIDTSLTFARQMKGLAPGSRVAIDDEIIYVYETNTNVLSADCERGDLGSVAAAHTVGTRVEVNPRFPQLAIRDALREEIQSWPVGLYRTGAIDVTISALSGKADITALPTDWTMILNVLKKPSTTGVQFDDRTYKIKFRVERDLATADFASGTGLFLDTTQAIGSNAYRVIYARPFDVTNMTDTANTGTDLGLEDTLLDIASLGAAWRLISTREIYRTFAESQGETRRAEEVPPMYATQAAAGLQKIRDKRIAEECTRAINTYPWRQMR